MDALQVLRFYTAGSFAIWKLAGKEKASCRAHLMGLLKGRKVPQAQAGINTLTAEFFSLAGISGECHAEREENFISWAKATVVRTREPAEKQAA